MSVSYGGDSIVFADGSVQSGGWTGMKNRIINGDMRIDQRNSGASTVPTDAYTLDRWEVREDTDGAVTCQQVADAPSGFVYSAKITTTTADASLTTTQRLFFRQPIEGNNIADLGFGSASASTVTLSFWVKSSLTGTFGGALSNQSSVRSYPFSYTISSANTWEQKTVTVAGDTAGTWQTGNGVGLSVSFGLGVGPDYSGTAGAWVTATRYSTTGAVSVIGTLSATWQITGVQLERGSTASSFEYRSYGAELALCQRYYFRKNIPLTNDYFTILQAYNTSSAYGKLFDLPVTMRATPTGSLSAIGSFRAANAGGSGSAPFTAGSVDSVSTTSIGTAGWSGASGIVAGNAVVIACGAVAWIAADAEL